WNEDRTVRVSSPFSGRVVAIEVKPGDRVNAGQTLAWLSSADYGSAQADARKAHAALELASKNAARSQDLFEHGVAAERDAEQAKADLAAAEA
ncbi:biotin/lipoyl-binding protein, partial [Acinetobacter baumannii]